MSTVRGIVVASFGWLIGWCDCSARDAFLFRELHAEGGPSHPLNCSVCWLARSRPPMAALSSSPSVPVHGYRRVSKLQQLVCINAADAVRTMPEHVRRGGAALSLVAEGEKRTVSVAVENC